MANLFDKAKENGTSKTKVEKHEVIEMPQFTKQLEKLANIDAQMAELQATRDLIDSEIREAGKETMISLYEKKGSFPGTLKIVAGEKSFLFITSDKYLKVDKERYEELVEMFGPDCLLYTSDAADDLLCVDLGGRRIIKKKKNKKPSDHNRQRQ